MEKMAKYKHDIDQYMKWLNDGKTYDEMAELIGVRHKSIIYNWVKTNYIIEKKVTYRAIKKKK